MSRKQKRLPLGKRVEIANWLLKATGTYVGWASLYKALRKDVKVPTHVTTGAVRMMAKELDVKFTVTDARLGSKGGGGNALMKRLAALEARVTELEEAVTRPTTPNASTNATLFPTANATHTATAADATGYIPIAKAAKEMGVGHTTVRYWTANKTVRAYQGSGKRWWVHRDDVAKKAALLKQKH